jgi:hypothetical protein
MMIAIKVNDNVNNLKIDNVNIEYSFKFYICMYSRKITSVIVQTIHLFMFSPFLQVSQKIVASIVTKMVDLDIRCKRMG